MIDLDALEARNREAMAYSVGTARLSIMVELAESLPALIAELRAARAIVATERAAHWHASGGDMQPDTCERCAKFAAYAAATAPAQGKDMIAKDQATTELASACVEHEISIMSKYAATVPKLDSAYGAAIAKHAAESSNAEVYIPQRLAAAQDPKPQEPKP